MLHDLQFTLLQWFEYEFITLFFKYNLKPRKVIALICHVELVIFHACFHLTLVDSCRSLSSCVLTSRTSLSLWIVCRFLQLIKIAEI